MFALAGPRQAGSEEGAGGPRPAAGAGGAPAERGALWGRGSEEYRQSPGGRHRRGDGRREPWPGGGNPPYTPAPLPGSLSHERGPRPRRVAGSPGPMGRGRGRAACLSARLRRPGQPWLRGLCGQGGRGNEQRQLPGGAVGTEDGRSEPPVCRGETETPEEKSWPEAMQPMTRHRLCPGSPAWRLGDLTSSAGSREPPSNKSAPGRAPKTPRLPAGGAMPPVLPLLGPSLREARPPRALLQPVADLAQPSPAGGEQRLWQGRPPRGSPSRRVGPWSRLPGTAPHPRRGPARRTQGPPPGSRHPDPGWPCSSPTGMPPSPPRVWGHQA